VSKSFPQIARGNAQKRGLGLLIQKATVEGKKGVVLQAVKPAPAPEDDGEPAPKKGGKK
jgi:hypothetical protein